MNSETKDIDKPKFSGIYCIKNKVNNMVYIGLSKNIHNRWIEHKYRLNTHIHPNTKLQNAWDKYGEDNFEFIVLEKCDYDVIYEREKYWIKKYKSSEREFGYNLSTGGENTSEGSTWTNTQKENASKLKNPKKVVQIDIYGNIIQTWRSASYASRMLDLRCSSIVRCCEHKGFKCGDSLWFYENDPIINSKENIRKFVLTHSSSINIPIIQYDLHGNIVAKYKNTDDIKNNINDVNIIEIRECCNHHKLTSKGYIWLFELDDFELSNEYLLKCRISSGKYFVEKYDFEGNYIDEYNKETLPREYRMDVVRANCINKSKSAYGFVWKYKGDDSKNITKEYIEKNNINGTKCKTIYVYNCCNELVKVYNSLKDAVAEGYTASLIRDCCNKKIKEYKNLIWRYEKAS